MAAFFPPDRDAVFAMVAAAETARFADLAAEFGGTVSLSKTLHEIEAENLSPAYECGWNHTTLQALKQDKGWTYLQVAYPRPFDPDLVLRQMERYGDEVLMHHEMARMDGTVQIFALPLVRWTTRTGCMKSSPRWRPTAAPSTTPCRHHRGRRHEGDRHRPDRLQETGRPPRPDEPGKDQGMDARNGHRMNRETTMKTLLLTAALTAIALPAAALDQVRFGTNWVAQGGHGGWYQAMADGTMEEYGIELEIVMGGPQVNNRPMLPAGRLDFLMAGNLLLSFDNVRNEIPTTVVAAFFQKDPQVLLAHKGAYSGWEDLVNAPKVLVSRDGQISYWQWLVAEHGFKDEQLRPYSFNLAEYLTDTTVVQQGYGTAEPIYAAQEGADPEWFLLADHGWNTYSTTVEARTEMVENNPDLVQRFVDASIIGWYNYLYGDNTLGNEAIIAANPEQTMEKLAAEVEQMKALGIVDVGDALELGIGAISLERIQAFYDLAVNAGILEAGSVDVSKVATDQFVNKGVGLELKAELVGD
jgi:NitT/TauT family transport system substrate-binding protein